MSTQEHDTAAAAETPRQPCGRETCPCSDDIAPRIEPPVRPDAEKLAALDTETAVAWEKRCEALDDRLLHHECAHAILDVASGRGIKFVQVTGSSGLCMAAQVGGRGWMMCILAGEVGGGIARRCILPPSRETIISYLAKVRRGDEDCGCDEFRLARFFVGLPESDDGICELWLRQWRRCVTLLADRIEGRIALARLTTELKKRRHMTGDEVEAVLDVEGLRAAFNEVFPE